MISPTFGLGVRGGDSASNCFCRQSTFTAEELDYILNCDIKYRLAADEDEETNAD